MQQGSTRKNRRGRCGALLILILVLLSLTSLRARAEGETVPATSADFPPAFLLASAAPPDFLAIAPAEKEPKKEEGTAITPFIGTNQVLTLLPPPERPAIAASDTVSLERPEVTAGVNVNLGTVKFNLGYTLPSSQVDNFVRPLGVDLEPGADRKRFSLGVKIPF